MDTPSRMTLGELRALHRAVEALADGDDGVPVGVLVRDTGAGDPAPWIEFQIAQRSFGIWRRTLAVFEADAHGAMGLEPVLTVEDLVGGP